MACRTCRLRQPNKKEPTVGLIFRKSIKVGRRSRVNVSKSGVSASTRVGPFSVSSRGRVSLRIGKGFSWRF
ncbi:hypothetical protein ASF30_09070 [Leifsonia sp. Leaf264]|nr:hypothetical protein ASF30_09070 [Leifsonia sp. Leaf264]